MCAASAADQRQIRVLVVGAGLGTNAGLGVEVPLAFGAFVTDGAGGVCEIVPEERSRRYGEGQEHFKCFMGEEFSYKWDYPCERDYKGNAGFLVGVLLKDPQLRVDVIQHPFNAADQARVVESRFSAKQASADARVDETEKSAVMAGLKAEKEDMWRHGYSEAHAKSIASLLHTSHYDVMLAGSKGIAVCLKALDHAPKDRQISAVVINGAEYHLPEYTSKPESVLPGQESESFVGHPLLRRLVLTSHGGLAGGGLRKCIVAARAKLHREGRAQHSVLMYSALDHRLVPNRESHSYPWSLIFPLECWFPGRGKPSRLVACDGRTVSASESMHVMDSAPLTSLVRWAAWDQLGSVDDSSNFLESIIQFPGPARFAEIRIEVAHVGSTCLSDEQLFQPINLRQLRSCPALLKFDAERYPHCGIPPWELCSQPSDSMGSEANEEFFVSEESPVFDVLFDAQVNGVHIVLKDIRTGLQMPLREILEVEGQYATRLIRFFRYYDDKSAAILAALEDENKEGIEKHADTGSNTLSAAKMMQFMLEEILAMNKNSGNFLWTGFMTPYTAYTPLKRFGTDLIELVINIEIARIGGTYLGFSRSRPNAEHTVLGQSACYGTALDGFLEAKANELKARRRRDFLSQIDFDSNMSGKLQKFDRDEEFFFREHGRQTILGYERREFDIGGSLSLDEAYAELERYTAQAGLKSIPAYHFSEFGHSTSFRIFPDGKAWLAASCQLQDFEWIQGLLTNKVEGAASKNDVIALLTQHKSTQRSSTGRPCHFRVPAKIVPPGFFQRNGYEVVAYRKYGDAGKQFNGVSGAWVNFTHSRSEKPVEEFWFKCFGPATRKTDTFGQFDKLPAEIGRGGTSAKLYCYDTEWKQRDDMTASVVVEGVNMNMAAWWELQLYGMTARNFDRVLQRHGLEEELASNKCLTYSSEGERLQQMLRKHFELDLATARNLWVAGIKTDGVPQSSRPFPKFGSFAKLCPELEELLGAFLEDKVLGHSVNLTSGVVDPSTKRRLFQELSEQVDIHAPGDIGTAASSGSDGVIKKTVLLKSEATELMSLGLRGFQEIGRLFSEPVRKEALAVRMKFLEKLQSRDRKSAQASAGSQQYLSRVADSIETDSVFTDLQDEVNVILDTLESCS